jgi:GNAT superfamily N-acetyltransferase
MYIAAIIYQNTVMNGLKEGIPQKFSIVEATPEDQKQIQALTRESWIKTMSETLGGSRERWEEAFDGPFEPSPRPQDLVRRTFVAKDGDTVLGVCVVLRNANERGENELLVLHVLPGKTAAGVGSALWRAGEKMLDPTKDTYLWTTPGTKAVEFYEKQGFEPVEYGIQHFKTREPLSRPRVKMVKRATIDKLQ